MEAAAVVAAGVCLIGLLWAWLDGEFSRRKGR